MTPRWWAPWALAAAVAAWVAAVLAAPVLPAWPAAFVYGVSSLVCHQLPERSLHWGPAQFAVCARCTGIYLGAAAASVGTAACAPARLAALHPRVRGLLVASAVPTGITVVAEWLGVWAPSHAARLVAGFPLGAGVMVALVVAIHWGGWPEPPLHHPRTR